MDARIREHAEIVAAHSTDMGEGNNVVISAPPLAEDLAVALHEVAGDLGANPVYLCQSARAQRGYLRARDRFETPPHELALIEESDVIIHVRADQNATETGDVDPETESAYSRAIQPIRQERLSKRWCFTQYPGPGNAQLAEMSTEAYENFVWDAINKDWDAQRAHQEQLVDRLEDADEVHIVSGEGTDIRLSVDGMIPLNDFGEHNLPGGEVFTAPIPDSVEGTVHFDMPLYHSGREVQDVRLSFDSGEVVEHSAGKNEELLSELLDTDAGARRLGELGIGMNRDIDRFTYNMLFDEKMGDTVHMALGMAYDDTVGEGRERNDSAIHVDMIVDMAEDSHIAVDGQVIQRDGAFVFEDEFEN